MVLSWSITEVVRYPYYAFTLLAPNALPAQLVYLRYSTFYVLYPTGAASEALVLFATLPTGRYGWAGILGAGFKGITLIWKTWGLTAYLRAVWLAVQFPGKS
jgi:very-long-chain (3R)-3-hydroxyacyl-CoA dehydratase